MSANKKIRKKIRKRHKKDTGPFIYRHPFSGMPKDELTRVLIEMGKSSSAQFPEILDKINSLIKPLNPLQTIASLSMYGLFYGINNNGERSPLHKDKEFSQSHVELLQALFLRIKIQDLSYEIPHPSMVQNLFDLLPELGRSFALQRMINMDKERSKEEGSIIQLQEKLRLHTQGIRNWGFFDSVLDIITKLYLPIDQIFVEEIGISATQILALFEYFLRETEYRVNIQWMILGKAFAENSIDGMVRRYFELIRHGETCEDLLLYVNNNKLSLEQVKVLILSFFDQDIYSIFTFNSALLARKLEIQIESVEKILKRLRAYP